MSRRTVTEPAPPAGAVGVARPRIEGRAKVTGAARYAADEPVQDLVHGCLVVATLSRGRIRDIDTPAVLGMPGVLGVLDHRDAPRLDPAAGHFFGPDGGLQLLQDDVIPFAGRPVALVVAETLEQAMAAAEALPVTYDEEPHDTDFSAGHPAARPALALFDGPVDVGDVDAELAASAVVVDQRYSTPEEHCGAMEPHSATAWWEGERLQAVDTNQGPFVVAGVLATLVPLDLDQVRVRCEHLGGGFGSKGMCGPQLVLAVMATTRFGRPARVTWTRDQMFLSTPMGPVIEPRRPRAAPGPGRFPSTPCRRTRCAAPARHPARSRSSPPWTSWPNG